MKKVFLFSFLSLLAVGKSWAIVSPVSNNGTGLPIEYVGCQMASIDNSTGTAAIIINSTGTNGRSTGGAVVYAVIASSIASSDYLVFKDTTGVGAISGYLAPQSTLTTLTAISTAMVLTNTYQNILSSTNFIPGTPQLNFIKLPVPVQFINGILVQASAAPQSNQGVSRWTIIYRRIGQAER